MLVVASVHEYVGKMGTSDTIPLCGHPAWDRRRYTGIRSHGWGFLSRQPSLSKRVLCFVKRLTSCHVIFQLGYMIYDMSTFYMSFERKKIVSGFIKRLPRVYLLFNYTTIMP